MAISGTIIVKFKRRRALQRTKAALGKAYAQVAKEMEAEMKRKTGRQGPPRSLAGQYPKMDTGNFNEGINVTGTVNGITVASTMRYGAALEYKDPNAGGRPWASRVMTSGDQRKRWEKRIAKLALQFSGGKAKKGR